MNKKKIAILSIASLVTLFLTGCNSTRGTDNSNVVSQRYIHKYGYAVSKQDWDAKQFPGQVITTLKNGVTITASYENGTLNGPSTYTFPHSQVVESYFLYNQGSLVKEAKYDSRGIPLKETTQITPTRYTTKLWYAEGTPMSIEDRVGEELMEGEYFTVNNEVESKIEKGNGLRIKRDALGTLLSKDKFLRGYLVKKESFYSSGTPESVAHFQKGIPHGEKKVFAQNGEPLALEEYINGKLHGKCTYFKNGSKFHEVSYIGGRKNGKEVHYLDGEKLSQEICWNDDLQHGACTYYIEGEPRTKWYYEGQEISQKRFKEMDKLDDMIGKISGTLRETSVR